MEDANGALKTPYSISVGEENCRPRSAECSASLKFHASNASNAHKSFTSDGKKIRGDYSVVTSKDESSDIESNTSDSEYVYIGSSQQSGSTRSDGSDYEILIGEHLHSYFSIALCRYEGIVKTKLSSGILVEDIISKLGHCAEQETCIHSGILFLDDSELKTYFSLDELEELKSIWRVHSTAYKYLKKPESGDEIVYSKVDVACNDFLAGIKKMKLDGKNAEEMWHAVACEGIVRAEETRGSHWRVIALRKLVINFLEMHMEVHDDNTREAAVMKNVWDTVFDNLSKNKFVISPAEESMKASKYRKQIHSSTVKSIRGRMADKCWKTQMGIEIAWQEASKTDSVCNPRKFSDDLLKTLKGTKDMIDFIVHKNGHTSETFGIVTSGLDIKIISTIRIPSGIYIARNIIQATFPKKFSGFLELISNIEIILKWLKAMDEIARNLEVPRPCFLDSDDSVELVQFPTMPTPRKNVATNWS
ncbi:hypothetical protein HK096_004020 [Nowakowskiella sp. JEL0078]|nr:hypothetical protein HK096_004020 [Nowakowskiella sp. JEL0078]